MLLLSCHQLIIDVDYIAGDTHYIVYTQKVRQVFIDIQLQDKELGI